MARPQSLSSTALGAILLSGAATGLSWLCHYRALQLAPASRVAPVEALSVVLVVVFATLFLHEELSLVQVGIGAAFVTLGAGDHGRCEAAHSLLPPDPECRLTGPRQVLRWIGCGDTGFQHVTRHRVHTGKKRVGIAEGGL